MNISIHSYLKSDLEEFGSGLSIKTVGKFQNVWRRRRIDVSVESRKVCVDVSIRAEGESLRDDKDDIVNHLLASAAQKLEVCSGHMFLKQGFNRGVEGLLSL